MSAKPAQSRTVVDQFDPAQLMPGGTDTCIRDLLLHGNQAMPVVGITKDPNVPLGSWTRLRLEGVEVDFLPVARVDRSGIRRKRLPHSLILATGLVRYRRSIPAGPLQAHRVEIGYLLKILFPRQPLIQFIHNNALGLTGTQSESVWSRLAPLYFLIERRVLACAASVVLFNATDAERIRASKPDLIVSETWFDQHLFFPSTQQNKHKTLHLIWVGRLESQKDPVLAVRAFAEVRQSVPTATLTIVGDGSLMADVRRWSDRLKIADCVHLVGNLTRDQVAEQMRAADLFLITSHFEGSPRAVVEAAACGLPIAATIESDPDGVVQDGLNGYHAASRGVTDLAMAILATSGLDGETSATRVQHRSASVRVPQLLADSTP